MSLNNNRKLYVMFLLFMTGLLFFSGISEYKAQEKSGTDEEFEQRLAVLMKEADGQGRESLTYNAILARVARQRAYDMGKRNYLKHVNPDGDGPNYLVRQAGYVLPDSYKQEKTSNSIESISAGFETVEGVWNYWMNSRYHQDHLLGFGFYAEQIEYGIGHAFVPESLHKHYWVVITAKPGKGGKTSLVATSPAP